ncbi:glycosyltransferase [Collinsella sp. AM20-15AC]|uniref:glycosyltransferase n=1 Tax=Collinsella sp. AM20-15AC TaxID=2292029 RepID=UPI000E4724C9|nr:glycosyltransferase [Collinsella sp. AM20-15AC]RHH02551.1 glycosyltransferase [Collinsella sp. AM20-15AC]
MSEFILPEYSVLMSVYKNDKAEYLNAAIDSMAGQTHTPHDYVIVCDGPLTPELDACLVDWGKRLGSALKVVRLKENHGLGYALNAGLSECRCNIVARMDADDISRRERCEVLLSKMVSERLDLVGGAIEEFDREPGDMGAVRMPPLSKKNIDTWLKERNPFNHVSVVFDRHMVDLVGGYEPFPWMEDYWLWARMIAKGCQCANVPDIVADVRTGEGMYARRSNMSYLKSQVRFFSELRKLGLVGRTGQVKAVAERAVATLLPTGLVKLMYNKLLRTRAGDGRGC